MLATASTAAAMPAVIIIVVRIIRSPIAFFGNHVPGGGQLAQYSSIGTARLGQERTTLCLVAKTTEWANSR
jgi:hypothetical protein